MQQQRAARALRLKEQAASLEAEAATWQLLWHLYGTEDSTFPAGTGRPLAAEKLTVSQRIAAVLADNQQLNWSAESLPCNIPTFDSPAPLCGIVTLHCAHPVPIHLRT